MIIWETSHWPGKYPVLNILLNMRVIALNPTSGNSCHILPVIRSYPGAFLERTCFIADPTSASLNFLTGVASRLGVRELCKAITAVI